MIIKPTSDLCGEDLGEYFACHDNHEIWMKLPVQGQTPTEAQPIVWEQLKHLFESKTIGIDEMEAVGRLRRATVNAMLKAQIDNPCYSEAGSTDPTSDLDFSFVTYVTPSNMLVMLLNFYEKFYYRFGNFSDVTFDTNYYICTTIINAACWGMITDVRVSSLFIPIANNALGLWFESSHQQWIDVDNDLAFIALQEHVANVTKHDAAAADSRLPDMIRAGGTLFQMLTDLDQLSPPSADHLKLLLRLLTMISSVNANEAYVSDYTVAFIVHHIPLPTNRARYLACIDNYAYVLEWATKVGVRSDWEAYVFFFNGSSKYIMRMLACLTSEGPQTIEWAIPETFRRLGEISKRWRDQIRGKVPLSYFQNPTLNEPPDAKLGWELLRDLLTIADSVVELTQIVLEVMVTVYNQFGEPSPSATQLYHFVKRAVRKHIDVQHEGAGRIVVDMDVQSIVRDMNHAMEELMSVFGLFLVPANRVRRTTLGSKNNVGGPTKQH